MSATTRASRSPDAASRHGPEIRFAAVSKRYHRDSPWAVRDFSLTIPAGSITVLLGSSGCGKSTLLQMINRLVDPTEGQVFIDGQDCADANPVELRRAIGYVLQDGGLLPHRTVVDNIATVPRLRGVKKKPAQQRAAKLMAMVDLDPQLQRRYPGQLSGGQRQRVGVARALAADSGILLMDEPFGAVDPIVRRQLQEQLRHLHSQLAKTIVFVTHDVDEAFALGDHIVVLKTGAEIAQVASPAQLLAQPADDFVAKFIGADQRHRQLNLQTIAGHQVVCDSQGRPLGVLPQ